MGGPIVCFAQHHVYVCVGGGGSPGRDSFKGCSFVRALPTYLCCKQCALVAGSRTLEASQPRCLERGFYMGKMRLAPDPGHVKSQVAVIFT